MKTNIVVMRNWILFVFLVFNISLVMPQHISSNKTKLTTPLIELSENNNDVWCKFQPNGYDCKENGKFTQNYYFDTKMEDCKLFNFGSCKQERNKFTSLKDCRQNCLEPGVREIYGKIAAKVYCKFQPDFGLCNEYYPKFYFDVTTRTCRGFSYSGCGGNLNRFSTLQLCSTACGVLADAMSKELLT